MNEIKITRSKYPSLFGGLGFHNNDASMYHVMEKEHFNRIICKNYREMSPGFMRTFAGFSDWTKEAMDEFAEYYEKMQKWTDTPMYITPGMAKFHSSEEAMKQYAEDVADNLSYLYFEKGVRHIRYYCFSNELSHGMYGVLLNDLPLFKRYHELLFDAFQKRKLPIGLLATDCTEYSSLWTIDWAIGNMANITEDYCIHIYEREHDIYNTEFYEFFKDTCAKVVEKGIINFGKRVIIGEAGIQKNAGQLRFDKGTVLDINRYCEDEFEEAYCGLMLTEMAFAAINAGIYALAYWSYCDHPAPYSCAYSSSDDEYAKKWAEREQFFSCTTDTKYNKHGITKWDDYSGDYGAKAFYWCIAPLVKFFKKRSYVLDIENNDPDLRSCGIINRDGSVSIGIVNRKKKNAEIKLDSDLFKKGIRVYEYDPRNVPFNEFCDMQEYTAIIDTAEYKLKAESVTFFTTDYIEKEERVFADNVVIEDDVLSWDEVSDKNHCYYRIYASDKNDFVPSKENQIASTVATQIPITDKSLFYKVLSVDKSGNV